FGAAVEFEGGVVEELGVVPGPFGVLEDEDGDVVVVRGRDAEGAQQAVADDVGGSAGAREGGFQGLHAVVDVLVAAFDEAVGVEDGAASGAEGDGAGGVQPAAGAQGRAGRFGGAADGAAGLVGGGHPEVVGLFELLGQERALEGDRGLALAGLAGAQALGGFDLVGDVGAEDQYALVRGDAGDLRVGGRAAGGDLDGG